MISDRFEFRGGPEHGHNYNVVTLRFNLRNPTGLSTPDISQRIRGILDPFDLKLNIVTIDDLLVTTTSLVLGDLVEEIKIPLSQVIEDKLSATVSFQFNQVYLSPESQNNDPEEQPTPAAAPLDGLLVILLAFLFT